MQVHISWSLLIPVSRITARCASFSRPPMCVSFSWLRRFDGYPWAFSINICILPTLYLLFNICSLFIDLGLLSFPYASRWVYIMGCDVLSGGSILSVYYYYYNSYSDSKLFLLQMFSAYIFLCGSSLYLRFVFIIFSLVAP